MTELLENIGHNIRRLRDEKGWNQTELGFRADTSPSIISLIENGKRNPSTATLAKIAGALGVEVVDLFPKGTRRSSLEPSFNDVLEEERRDPTLAELNAIETLKDYCDRLEEFLSEAKQKKIARTLWFMEADTAINMAALSLPLVEQERLRPRLLPTAARLVQLAHEVFDGARNAGAVVPEDANNVIDMVERRAG